MVVVRGRALFRRHGVRHRHRAAHGATHSVHRAVHGARVQHARVAQYKGEPEGKERGERPGEVAHGWR